MTGINIDITSILGEEKLEEYKEEVKIIDRYKNNIKEEEILKNEILALETSIKRANDKIKNNERLNKQLEEKMIRIGDKEFRNLVDESMAGIVGNIYCG